MKKMNNSSPVVIKTAVILAVVVAFFMVLYYATLYRSDLATPVEELPLIAAPEGAVKTLPAEEGGMEIPNQDAKVFDLLAGSNRVAPLEEQAVLASKSPTTLVVGASPTAPVAAVSATAEVVAVEISATALAAPKPVQEKPAPVEKTEPKKEEPAPKKVQGEGEWGVQLASFVSESDAKKALTTFQKKYGAQLKNLETNIQKASTASTGVRYRAQFFGLASKAEAENMCRTLKRLNQGCLHVKR